MYLTAANLDAISNLRHGFFTRQGGVSQGTFSSLNCSVSSGDVDHLVQANRAIAMEKLGLPAGALAMVKLVHGKEVHRIEEPASPGQPINEADALVTNRRGIALGVLGADCAPILLADATAGVIGAAHAGWKSALAGVVDNVVEEMLNMGAETWRITAAVGPCIAKPSYEVGPDMRAKFEEADPDGLALFEPVDGSDRYHFDLKAYVLSRLTRIGVEKIEVLPEDTFTDERFFSARRSKKEGQTKYGNLLSTIAMIDDGKYV